MQILGVVTQSRSYAFGPKRAPCHKYLQLEDGMQVRARHAMLYTGQRWLIIGSREVQLVESLQCIVKQGCSMT
jgi:hypothetical protein